MNAQLLLVDDESAILDMLAIVLHKEGFTRLATAASGEEALRVARDARPDLIVLDVMLPDLDGYEVCRRLRRITQAPILFLTARSTDLDKLTGFSAGGDDYITKPFNPLEAAARIKAHLRRYLPQSQGESLLPPAEGLDYEHGRFRLRETSGELFVDGALVPLPAKEFQLLLHLCRHPNRIFSRQQLYEAVWGEASYGDDNTVMVHIRRLREKIEDDPSRPRHLVTVRGLGYKLAPQEAER